MRLYKFYSKEWALDALRKQRLKISTIGDLNDPFEFVGSTSSNPEQRRIWHKATLHMFASNGLISFAEHWSNPVLWSHYADRHRGAALGFDVNDKFLWKVKYRSARKALPDLTQLSANQRLDLIKDSVQTKFLHWNYEAEQRIFVNLDPKEEENGLYFKDFDDDLVLKEVIIGVRSDLTSTQIAKSLDDKTCPHVTTSRLAFGSYRVVPQRNKKFQR